jgi:glycosyltransferase involved in cell wall biosynthesis
VAIGSLKSQKDYPTLLKAFVLLRDRRPARLLILGEGPERPALERLIGELGLVDRVRLAGYVADPYPYLEMADLFVLSSAWEGLGNVIIEALVCGTPVVATDCRSGPAEILENGRYGRLVPVSDPESLAAAMAASLTETPDRDVLRARGAEFSVERAADQYLELLDPGGRLLAGA